MSQSDTQTLSPYDKRIGALVGLPGSLHTKATTLRSVTSMVGRSETFIVQTYRVRDPEDDGQTGKPEAEILGDTIFLEYFGPDGVIRLALPPKVANTIARQRESLTGMVRGAAAQQAMRTKRERGITLGNPAALRKARAARKKKR